VEFKQIKELMATMGRTGTKRLLIEENGFKLELERNDLAKAAPAGEYFEDYAARQSTELGSQLERAALNHMKGYEFHPQQKVQIETTQVDSGVYITSPMVGTFYISPAPEEPSFIKIGDKVEKNNVVCIIEAMKVMNEVKAGIAGTVAEIMVENGQAVEFGTKLLRIT